MLLHINKWSKNDIQLFSNFLIIGKRGTGKTWISKEIILHYIQEQLVEDIYIFTSDVNSYELYFGSLQLECLPRIHFYSDKWEVELDILMSHSNKTHKLLVFDNVIGSSSTQEKLKQLICQARQNYFSTIMTVQYPMYFNNVDHVFMLRDNIVRHKYILYNEYNCMFESYTQFDHAFTQITESPYCALVINANSMDNNVKWFKAGGDIIELSLS